MGRRQSRAAAQGRRRRDASATCAPCCATCSAVSACRIAVIPATPDSPSDHRSGGSEPGFDVRLIDRQLVVSSVDANGGAASAGVHAGWIVNSIDGAAVSKLLAGIADGSPPRIAQLEAWRLAVTRLRGEPGSKVDVSFTGTATAPVPRSRSRSCWKRAPATVGLLDDVRPGELGARIDARGPQGRCHSLQRLDDRRRRAVLPIDRFRGADGIVIDLRGILGGLAGMIMGIAWPSLRRRPRRLGVMKTKDATELVRESAARQRRRRTASSRTPDRSRSSSTA